MKQFIVKCQYLIVIIVAVLMAIAILHGCATPKLGCLGEAKAKLAELEGEGKFVYLVSQKHTFVYEPSTNTVYDGEYIGKPLARHKFNEITMPMKVEK